VRIEPGSAYAAELLAGLRHDGDGEEDGEDDLVADGRDDDR
jgi:hypothetical protein